MRLYNAGNEMRQKSLGSFVLFMWLMFATQGFAAALQPHLACDFAAQQAAEGSGVPLSVMMSVARAESGTKIAGEVRPWPWTANVSGKGYFFATQQEALDFSSALLNQGDVNFDVGCFQVNLRWHSKGFTSLENAFDPMANARYAAGFLADLYQEKGNWSDAVAAYHSRTPIHAERYLKKVKLIWRGLQAKPSADVPAESAAPSPSRINTFPLLVSGQGSYGSLVPQGNSSPVKFGLR